MLSFLILLAFPFVAVDSLLYYSGGQAHIDGDLDVSGRLYNHDLWQSIYSMLDTADCRIESCNGHGTCNIVLPNCTCDKTYCGQSCTVKDSNPVSYVSSSRVSDSIVQVVFKGTNCTQLATNDEIQLVRGTCTDPIMLLQSITNASIVNGTATFDVTTTGLYQPFTVCYRLDGTGTYRTLSGTPTYFDCSNTTDYFCPSLSSCVSNCASTCPGYTYPYDPFSTCLANVGPLGTPMCVNGNGWGCNICRGPATIFFDGDTGSGTQGDQKGSCAVINTLPGTYWIYQIKAYPVWNFESRLARFDVLFFNSSVQPVVIDSGVSLYPKAYTLINSGPTVPHDGWNGWVWTFNLNPPLSAKHVAIAQYLNTWMDFAELELYAAPF